MPWRLSRRSRSVVNSSDWNPVRDEGSFAMDPPSFAELVSRARSGDTDAVRRLVELYEPVIRRQVRFSLLENKLRRVLEEADVCQSVMGRFFAGLEQRRFELDGPEQLNGLLKRLVRNKITDQARYWKAGRRDYLRNIIPIDPDDPVQPISPDPTPSRVVADADFLARFEGRLSDERADDLRPPAAGHELARDRRPHRWEGGSDPKTLRSGASSASGADLDPET